MASDGRDWGRYNNALVRRGEILLDFKVLKEWRRELERINEGKVGEPYHYPDSFMRLLGFIHHLFHLPYRQTEGFIRAFSRRVEGLQTPDYTTIERRVNRLHITLEEALVKGRGPVTIAVDASGVKVHNGGDWVRRVWGVRKGYLKIHFAVDTESKQIVAMDVTSERVHEGKRLGRLVKRASRSCEGRVGRVLADGGYDSRANFKLLAAQGIEPVIRVRGNSTPKSGGCMARKLAVAEQLRDRRGWAERHGYGLRWRVEGAFSCLKRTFGEYVSARKFVNMAREMAMKANLYNLFMASI